MGADYYIYHYLQVLFNGNEDWDTVCLYDTDRCYSTYVWDDMLSDDENEKRRYQEWKSRVPAAKVLMENGKWTIKSERAQGNYTHLINSHLQQEDEDNKEIIIRRFEDIVAIRLAYSWAC